MTDATLQLGSRGTRGAALRLLGDDRLARRAARGDADAFAVVCERYHQPLYRYCRAITGNDEDAADALQNALLSAMRALPGETRAIALKPWLYRIAHNEAVSLLRRRRPHADLGAAADLESTGPEVDSDIRERIERLMTDLAELPERLRGALVMRELSGLGYDEIATALGTTRGGAKQALYDARGALHDFERGREMSCEEVMRQISARDGRRLRARRTRAHLRGCAECRSFRDALGSRQADLGALAPPLPAAAAGAILQGVIGGGSGGGPLGALAGWAVKVAAGPALAKGLIAGVAAVAVGAGAVDLATGGRDGATTELRATESGAAPGEDRNGSAGDSTEAVEKRAGGGAERGERAGRGDSPSGGKEQNGPAGGGGGGGSWSQGGGDPAGRGGPPAGVPDGPPAGAPGPGLGEQQAQQHAPGRVPPAARQQLPSGSPQGGGGIPAPGTVSVPAAPDLSVPPPAGTRGR